MLDTLGTLDPGMAGVNLSFAYLLTAPIDYASEAEAVPIVP